MQNRLLRLLQSPHQTEKAVQGNANNQYVFKVEQRATKETVKQAVEQIFSVQVFKVRVVNVKRKRIEKFGRLKGWKKGWKKVYVSLKPGHAIELSKLE